MSNYIAHIRNTDRAEQTLAEHLQGVSALAGEFTAKVGLKKAGQLMGLLHDLGKYLDLFQKYIKSAVGLIEQDSDDYTDPRSHKGKIDHSSAGGQRVWNHFKERRTCIPQAQMLALGIVSHHSGLIDVLAPDRENVFLKRMDKGQDASLKNLPDQLTSNIDPEIEAQIQTLLNDPELMHSLCLAGRDIWKNTLQNVPPQEIKNHSNAACFKIGLLTRFLLSCLLDADRIDSAEFEDPSYKALRRSLPKRPWTKLLTKFEEALAEKSEQPTAINQIRREIAEHCLARAKDEQGIFSLTVPTGGGKTLSSLRFALHHAEKHQLDRIIYIIPYTSILDQNAQVARDILEKDEEPGSIVLEHHSNLQPEMETWQNQMLGENWEAPVVFTTMVQFLETLFGAGTKSTRRMHNLARSVIIFDEIQTLPLHCTYMFCNALNYLVEHCHASAVLCTATQPLLGNLPEAHKGQLNLKNNSEIMPDTQKLFNDLKRVEFINHCQKTCQRPMTAEEIVDLALTELKQTGSCLVICNTKKWAEKLYQEALQRNCGAPVYYLSTNICAAHRKKKLKELVNSTQAGLCFSTQLIECGVDISFGSVIRFAAGLDSILQAAGRCNRHGNASKPGRVHIVTVPNEEEQLSSLEDIQEGKRIFLYDCAKLFEKNNYNLTDPELIQAYFQSYFRQRQSIMAYAVRGERDDTLLNMLGCNSVDNQAQPDGNLRQSFASAAKQFQVIKAATTAVVVPYGQGQDIIAQLYSNTGLTEKRTLLRKAQAYTVNVYSNDLERLKRSRALHEIEDLGILTLNPGYYCENLGLCPQGTGQLQPNHF